MGYLARPKLALSNLQKYFRRNNPKTRGLSGKHRESTLLVKTLGTPSEVALLSPPSSHILQQIQFDSHIARH